MKPPWIKFELDDVVQIRRCNSFTEQRFVGMVGVVVETGLEVMGDGYCFVLLVGMTEPRMFFDENMELASILDRIAMGVR